MKANCSIATVSEYTATKRIFGGNDWQKITIYLSAYLQIRDFWENANLIGIVLKLFLTNLNL